MSMHNNSSSTLPFIPSSTGSLLTSSYSKSNQGLANAQTSSQHTSSQQQAQQLRPSWQPQPPSASSQQVQHRKFQSSRTSVNTNPSKSPSSSSTNLVSVPIRHWWMAVFHHHGDQHSSSQAYPPALPPGGSAQSRALFVDPPGHLPADSARASRVKRLLESAEARENFTQCLHEDVLGSTAQHDILSVQGESAWEDRVCATSTLNDRVHVLLEALPCPQHRVCQILSPTLLRRLARPDECRQVARELWRNVFHKLYLMIRDFSDVLQQKFDIGDYWTMHRNEMCKVRNDSNHSKVRPWGQVSYLVSKSTLCVSDTSWNIHPRERPWICIILLAIKTTLILP